MALRASATARHPLPQPLPPLPPRSLCLSKSTASTTQFRPSSVPPSITSTTLSLFALFTAPPHEAKALSLPKEQVVSSLTQVVAETVKPGIDVALPILKQGGEQAVKIASPVVSEASKKALDAIQSSGFDTQPVLSAAKTVADAAQQTTKVIEAAKPIASSTVETISSTDPVTIVGAGGALFLVYLLFPPIWSAVSFSLRGYKAWDVQHDDGDLFYESCCANMTRGELSPAQALDLISSRNYLMIDIRSEKDKNKAGIPRLPSSAKNRVIAIPLEELPSKLKGLVRNAKKVEAEIAALKISYLKKISKGSNIVIMDSLSDSAKIAARTLTSLGFKNCWVVAGGFSGGRGWLQSRLGADSYNVSIAEVLSPSRVIPAAVQRFGTTTSAKLLPGGSD
ncbi:hypothetical protein C3L33_04183, partial [Rhododendron williamsianum]